MSENAASPKRGLFQSLSKRVSGYRSKKKDDPSSPRSHASETTSEGQRSVDDVDLLEVQVSGKSARSARRLTSRPGLSHLKSAPAGALQAAAEQAVADILAASTAPIYARVSEDYSNHSSAYSPQSARARMSRKISGNKLILSDDGNMEAKDGEFMLPPEATPFAQTGRAAFDDLEICFSGKSARMSRGGMRRPDMHTIAAH
ncbi:hypothetical protein WJX82_000806 [Trebouxia sp. C0006]